MNYTNLKIKEDPLLFLRNNPNPMWIFDHETLRFREVNRAAIVKYGYSRSEFLKMKITQIRPKEQVPKLIAGIRPFRLAGDHIDQRQHLTKNGELIDVELTASQFYFKGRPSVLVEVQDITERKRAEETLRQLAIAEERNRIAREIHDTLAQAFTGILLQLEAAQDVLKRSPNKAKEHIIQARNLAKKSLLEARRSVLQIRPQQLRETPLPITIRRMADKLNHLGISISCCIEGIPRELSSRIENNLLRISQEALTNAIRHACATKLYLTLSFNDRTVQVIVKDNGTGFLPTGKNHGFGLTSICERANQIGAKVKINSTPGKGSKVIVIVPA
jgi:PAS domain S-box-containing protein